MQQQQQQQTGFMAATQNSSIKAQPEYSRNQSDTAM